MKRPFMFFRSGSAGHVAILGSLLLICHCTTTQQLGFVGDDAGAGVSFNSPDAGDAASADAAQKPLCIATECLAPYATCGDEYRCGTNLSTDSKNCGACNKECPTDFGYLNLTSSCVAGRCLPACATKDVPFGGRALNFADCNNTLEDGCEVVISTDPNNCGACGNQCAPGVRCIDGKCGCDLGQMDCDGRCIDVRNNDNNCGGCGNVCEGTPEDAGSPPPNMYYGCGDGQCGQLKCVEIFGERWANCDNDVANGCEIYVGEDRRRMDRDNCGFCANKCTPGQLCWDANLDHVPECGCQPYETMCGSFEASNLGCYDLLNNSTSCGTCFNKCPVPQANQISACKKGVCVAECAPGWGDCDLDPANGCETNLNSSDGHCGVCGNRCDTHAGQPCIEGRCVMTECDAGRGPQ